MKEFFIRLIHNIFIPKRTWILSSDGSEFTDEDCNISNKRTILKVIKGHLLEIEAVCTLKDECIGLEYVDNIDRSYSKKYGYCYVVHTIDKYDQKVDREYRIQTLHQFMKYIEDVIS